MPFAVVFVELFFIFKGIWSNQYTYFIVGFLAIVFLILVATAANRLAISPDGRFLAVADTNAHAYVWSLS